MTEVHAAACYLPEAQHVRRYPPGPPSLPLIGNLPFLRGDGFAKLTEWARIYGDIFQYRSFHLPVCFVNDPAVIEEVLVTSGHQFIHGRGVQANPRFLGRGLLTNEGEAWRQQRRIMMPSFHQRSIQRFAELIVRRTEKMLEGWRAGEAVDIYRRMATSDITNGRNGSSRSVGLRSSRDSCRSTLMSRSAADRECASARPSRSWNRC